MPRYFTQFWSRQDERCTGVWSHRFSAPRRINLRLKGNSCPGTEISGIAHKELLFILCSTDWRLWYLVASDFAFVSGFFILTRSEFPQRHVSPPSQTPLREGDFNLLWDYSQDMKTGQWASRTPKTSLCWLPQISQISCLCVSHETQCLGFDTEWSDGHTSFSFTVRVPQAYRDVNTHAVSSFLLLSVWPVSVDVFQMNEFKFGVLCWFASNRVIKSPPVKSKTCELVFLVLLNV